MTNASEANEDVARSVCKTVCREATKEEFEKELARIEAAMPDHGPGIDEPKIHLKSRLGEQSWNFYEGWSAIFRYIRAEFFLHEPEGGIAVDISGRDRELVRRLAEVVVGAKLEDAAEKESQS